MSRESERVAIVNHFLGSWDQGLYPTKMSNQPFVEPDDKLFCHFLILQGDEIRMGLGKTNYLVRCLGIIQFDIYAPVDTGVRNSNLAEEAFTALFQDKILTTSDSERITFQQPRPMNFGPRNDKYRITVRAPFSRDTYRSTT